MRRTRRPASEGSVRICGVRGRIIAVLAGLSFSLSIAICVLWVRSYPRGEMFDVECDEHVTPSYKDNSGTFYGTTCDYRIMELLSERGGVAFEVGVGAGPGRIKPWRLHHRGYSGSLRPIFSATTGKLGKRRCLEIQTKYSVALMSLLTMPAGWIIRLKMRHRMPMTERCVGCGYDLRATSNRCPECGKVTSGAA